MTFPTMSDHEFTQRILHIVRVQSNQLIPAHVARTASFSLQEQVSGDMLLGLSAEVLRDHIVHEVQDVTLDIPSSWWQTFKQTYQNDWWLRRFAKRYPVRYTTMSKRVTFDRYYDYPDAAISLPEENYGKFIVSETIHQNDWERR